MAKVNAAPAVPAPSSVGAYSSNPLTIIQPSARAVVSNIVPLIIVTILTAALFAIAAMVAVGIGILLYKVNAALGVLAGLVIGLVGFYYAARQTAALPTIVLIESAKGTKVQLGEVLKRGRATGLVLMGTTIMVSAAILGGYIFLLVPGVLFTAWLSLAVIVAVDEGLSVIDSLRRSLELTKGRTIDMIGVSSLAAALGVLLSVIPVHNNVFGAISGIVIIAWYLVLLAALPVRYIQLKAGAPVSAKPHWLNYVIIAILIIGTPAGIALSIIDSAKHAPASQQNDPLMQTTTPSDSLYQ